MTSSVPNPSPPLPRAVGRYEVVRLLGEGAMGRVLLARDPVLDREVAIKHLRGDLRIPRDVRKGLLTRMRHEARAAGRVPHPNLVVLHDMGEDPAVGLYLVFEYVEGPTLKQRLLDDGRLPPGEAAKLAAELGSALTITHEAGILHRDIKPENVMLGKTGGKIADFGIARIPGSTLTLQGGLMGTPAYSAPETFRGGTFSRESDQFSLAATLYEAISGRRAFPGDDAAAVAAKIAHDDPEPVAAALGLPPTVDEALARGMARRPEQRFPSCEALGAAIAKSLTLPSAVDAAPDQPRSIPVVAAAPDLPAERKPSHILLGAAVVVVTIALLVHAATRSPDTSAAPADASASADVSPPSARVSSAPPSARAVRHPRPAVPSPSASADAGAPQP